MVRLSNSFTLLYGESSNSPTVLLALYDTFAIFRPTIKEQATAKSQQAAQWLQRIVDLKNAFPCDDQAIEEAEAKVKELTRESRNLTAKAKEIEDTVYDLKAVNPHIRLLVDTRTPQEIAEALALLRNLDYATEPILPKFPNHLLGREVEINLGRGEPIVPQEPLQGRQ
jgi:hypothetical protein